MTVNPFEDLLLLSTGRRCVPALFQVSHRVAYCRRPGEMTYLKTCPSISRRFWPETSSHPWCNSSRPMVCFGHLHWPKVLDTENRNRRAELVLMHRVASPFCRHGRTVACGVLLPRVSASLVRSVIKVRGIQLPRCWAFYRSRAKKTNPADLTLNLSELRGISKQHQWVWDTLKPLPRVHVAATRFSQQISSQVFS